MALAVLGTAFTMLLAAHTSATRLEAEARNLFEATTLAREVLSRTEIDGLPAFDKDEGDFGPDFPTYRWEREVADVPSLPFVDLREVTVRVLWQAGTKTRSTQVVFYYLKKDP